MLAGCASLPQACLLRGSDLTAGSDGLPVLWVLCRDREIEGALLFPMLYKRLCPVCVVGE